VFLCLHIFFAIIILQPVTKHNIGTSGILNHRNSMGAGTQVGSLRNAIADRDARMKLEFQIFGQSFISTTTLAFKTGTRFRIKFASDFVALHDLNNNFRICLQRILNDAGYFLVFVAIINE